MKSYLGQTNLPRGIRNNNPGNLVITSIPWQGKIPVSQNTDGHFEQFTSVAYGIRAMALDIMNDINKGLNTLQALIYEYAPPHENNTQAYIDSVATQTGISPSAPVPMDTTTLAAIIKAKINVENGPSASQYITDQDINEGLSLISGITLKKKISDDLKEFWPIYLAAAVAVALLIFYLYKNL